MSAGGAHLDIGTVRDIPVGTIVRAQIAVGDSAACVAATVVHECETIELARALRPWAGARGWSVTVAPLTNGG